MISKILKGQDLFEKPVPMFNVKGKERIQTVTGGITSIFIMSITLLFALNQLKSLLERSNPSLNVIRREEVFDTSYSYKMDGSQPLQMAFTLANLITGEPLDDPRIVKWVAVLGWMVDGVMI